MFLHAGRCHSPFSPLGCHETLFIMVSCLSKYAISSILWCMGLEIANIHFRCEHQVVLSRRVDIRWAQVDIALDWDARQRHREAECQTLPQVQVDGKVRPFQGHFAASSLFLGVQPVPKLLCRAGA